MLLFTTAWGWSYLLAVPMGVAAAVMLGSVVELLVIRRFRRAPRLLLTVATIGLSQLLAAGALLLPSLWHTELLAPHIAPRSPSPSG